MNSRITRILASLLASLLAASAMLLLATPQMAHGGPLNVADIPDDVKWVVHVDVDEFKDTGLADRLGEEQPELFQRVSDWLEDKYGMNPQEDLHAMTFFGDTYAQHTGTVVISADFDKAKVEESLASKQTVKSTTWQGITLLTCYSSKHADSHVKLRDSDKNKSQEKAHSKKQSQKESKNAMTIALLDGKAVVASSPQRVKDELKLLRGNESALKQSSPLLKQIQKGAIVYGAATNLSELQNRDYGFPILSQHQQVIYTIGEREDQMFEKLTLEANTKDVATKMKDVLEGFSAAMQLYTAENDTLSQLFDNVQIDIQGRMVNAEWHADTQVVLESLDEICNELGMSTSAKAHSTEKADAREDLKR